LSYTYRRVTQAPNLDTLAFYQGVVWLTGNQSTDTLTSADQANLAAYLDGRGRLFLSGQDIGIDIGGSGFYHDYLHTTFHSDDTNVYTLTGLDFMTGLDVTIQSGEGANNQFYPSDISPVSGGIAVYRYPDPHLYGGVAYSGTHRVVYFSFGYEAINSQARRDGVMSATLNYLGVCGAPQAPQARFVSTSPTQWGEATQFTNATQGTAWITYTWDFGDGMLPAHSVNVTHVYTQPGTYTVVLTATNRYGQSVCSDTVVIAAGCVPVAGVDLTFSPTSPTISDTVRFTGTVTLGTAPITYTWDFGDGTPAINGTTVAHTFPAATTTLTYTVTLTVTNSCSFGVTSRLVTVHPVEASNRKYIYLPMMFRN
jgi:PKD repeat protein